MPLNHAELEAKCRMYRQQILEAVFKAKKGHIGGTYSCLELLAYLYHNYLNLGPPDAKLGHSGDTYLMGKGHANLAVYACLQDLGLHHKEWWDSYGQDGAPYGGQISASLPHCAYNTGSLGHVLGIGCGIALANKLDKRPHKTVVMLGDAECGEGSIWEAAMFAGNHQLSNLTCIIDRNRLGVTGPVEEELEPLKEKFEAFKWKVFSIDGHNFHEIHYALEDIGYLSPPAPQKPKLIIANTIKGKGIDFMQAQASWHHGSPDAVQFADAMKQLETA